MYIMRYRHHIVLLFICFGLCAVEALAQSTTAPAIIENGQQLQIYNSNGQPFHTDADVDGTPFFNELPMNASLVLFSGQVIHHALCKIDLYRNEVHFMKDGKEFGMPAGLVKRIIFSDSASDQATVFQCGYPANGSQTAVTLFRVVVDGETELLHLMQKNIEQDHNPLTGIRSAAFVDVDAWFIYDQGRLTVVTRDKSKLRLLAAGHIAATKYLDAHVVNNKNPARLKEFVQLCNE